MTLQQKFNKRFNAKHRKPGLASRHFVIHPRQDKSIIDFVSVIVESAEHRYRKSNRTINVLARNAS